VERRAQVTANIHTNFAYDGHLQSTHPDHQTHTDMSVKIEPRRHNTVGFSMLVRPQGIPSISARILV
jgi:hypothetical protein